MSNKTKPPTGWRPGAARNADRFCGLIGNTNIANHVDRQALRLAGRFRLPLPTARTLAELAFTVEAVR